MQLSPKVWWLLPDGVVLFRLCVPLHARRACNPLLGGCSGGAQPNLTALHGAWELLTCLCLYCELPLASWIVLLTKILR